MKPFLTVAAVAGELGIHPETVRRYLKSGKLKGQKAGRDWLISRACFTAFLKTFTPRTVGRPRGPLTMGEADAPVTPPRPRGRPRKTPQETPTNA